MGSTQVGSSRTKTLLTSLSYIAENREEWKFITNKLSRQGIASKWGFPFKLLANYKGQTVTLTTKQQTKKFFSGQDKEVAVIVLNQLVNGSGSGRRTGESNEKVQTELDTIY